MGATNAAEMQLDSSAAERSERAMIKVNEHLFNTVVSMLSDHFDSVFTDSVVQQVVEEREKHCVVRTKTMSKQGFGAMGLSAFYASAKTTTDDAALAVVVSWCRGRTCAPRVARATSGVLLH